ncbi:MAG: long-chain-fatty-acid--CoA ligase [Caulobacter sp.]|nr:long-chain-fatty-acid--CoA ligase [Caulobacter sp.]
MQGLMQHSALTVDTILDHAKRWHGDREVVTRSVEGPIVRTTYGQIHDRAKRLSNALIGMGVRVGDRVATLAWNSGRHMEAWYAIMGIGAVCHTLNPRLHPEQIAWIINHAEDRIIFVDLTFVPILEAILANCPSVEHVVIMTDKTHMPPFQMRGVPTMKWQGAHTFETLIDGNPADCAWGGFDENTAAGLCYTSGTTGDPKGVLYSHRSNYIHTLVGLQSDVLGVSATDTVLPVVPMFHANAWGIAFAGPGVGAKLVMPGAKMDGASIHELLETEGVTFSAAVPTVWQMLLQHLDATNGKLSTLKRVVIGGSACPESIIRGFHDRYGVDVLHAWGMTETSPLGTLGSPNARVAGLSYDERMAYKLKQGRPPLGIDLKLTDDAGAELPHDGSTFGHLLVKGPFVVREYFKGAGGNILDDEGYFDTGDVATIDPEGFMQITDRAKDVIKSGGEWISTIDIENIAMGHPKVELAAVIGVLHPKWDERPLLLIKLKPGETATKEEMLQFLVGKIAKWWMPDDVAFVDDIPLGATGKIDKKLIRERMKDYVLPATPVMAAAAAATIAERAAPSPVLHAPEPVELEDPSGKSEAPTSTAAVGAEELHQADTLSNTDAAEPVAEPTAHAPADGMIDAEFEPIEPGPVAEAGSEEPPASSPSGDDGGDVPPPLPGMPDMTPVGAALAAAAAAEAASLTFPQTLKDGPGKALPDAETPASYEESPLWLASATETGKRKGGRKASGKKKPAGWANAYLNLALLVALAPAAMVLVGAAGMQLGQWDQQIGIVAMLQNGVTPTLGWAPAAALVGALTSVLGLLVATFGGFSRLWGKALLALAITAATWAALISFQSYAARMPPLADVATDWSEPLMFSPAMLAARGPEANYVDPQPVLPIGSRFYAGRPVGEVNAETCPNAQPAVLGVSPQQAYVSARAAVQTAGLALVHEDPAAGLLEATATGLLYGLKRDVVVRVKPEGAGARVDVRSVSRTESRDLGANCRQIGKLLSALSG